MHRVVGKLWIRDVSLRAMDGQPARQRSAAPDLDCVAEHLVAAGLADDAPVDALTARSKRFDHAFRAVDGRSFLVAGEQEGERATMIRIAGDESLRGDHHRRETALHVRRAAAVKATVADLRHEGIGGPVFPGSCRDDVGVTREAEHRCRAAAPGPEVIDGPEG